MIIGITGQNKSGKGTVAGILEEEHGFIAISLSDFLRYDLKTAGMPITRKNLQKVGNSLRKVYGTSYLARRAIARIEEIRLMDSKNKFVIESIRNPGEAEFLKEHGAAIWDIRADKLMRYKRMMANRRMTESKGDNDPANYKEFLECEEKENNPDTEYALQVSEVEKYANAVIKNEGSVELLRRKVRKALTDHIRKQKIEAGNSWLSWDEYLLRFVEWLSGKKNGE